MRLVFVTQIVLFTVSPSDGIPNDSTVVLDSIAYRIWTDTTNYPMTQCCIPVNFEYSNLTGDTLNIVSSSGNVVRLSFSDSEGREYLHYVISGTSHYHMEPFDTLVFADTASSGMVEWRPDAYVARGRPDIWNEDLPYAEVTLLIQGSVTVTNKGHFAETFSFDQPFPNPFNPTTTIGFSIPQAGLVTLTVYDLLGRGMETILNRHVDAGRHKVLWDASNVRSGIYFVRMKAGDPSTSSGQGFTQTRKMVLLR